MTAAPDSVAQFREDAPLAPTVRSGELAHPLIQDLLLDPARWSIWPAVAALRWLLRRGGPPHGLAYRSTPALRFPTSEITDIVLGTERVQLVLEAPGLASAGSLLPTADIARLLDDRRRGGGLCVWLDASTDRFMQAAEAARARFQGSFSLATGGPLVALDGAAEVAGRSAPLADDGAGRLRDTFDRAAHGAPALAGLFVGPPSAAGLGAALEAFTSLAVAVTEFAGATLDVLRPARLGAGFGAMIGLRCTLPAAGVDVVVEGGADPRAQAWARSADRRASLYLLACAYVGSPAPIVRIALRLAPENAPPAALDGGTAFGGLAVLGRATAPVRVPLTAPSRSAEGGFAKRSIP